MSDLIPRRLKPEPLDFKPEVVDHIESIAHHPLKMAVLAVNACNRCGRGCGPERDPVKSGCPAVEAEVMCEISGYEEDPAEAYHYKRDLELEEWGA